MPGTATATRAPKDAPPLARSAGRRWLRIVLLAAAALPPLAIARAVDRYGVNVPYWDQWVFVPFLVDVFEGRFALSGLWAQHNEHRLVLPRLAMLGLARLTHWNVRWEMAVSIVVQVVSLGVLAALVRRTVRALAAPAFPALVLATSLLLFSLSQWENWICGWQIQIFMLVLSAAVSAWLLARWDGSWAGLAGILAVAVCGVLSFGSGLVLLALVVPAACLVPQREPLGARLARAVVALAVLTTITVLYYVHFTYPGQHPSPLYVVHHPGDYATYVMAYVGAGFGAWAVGPAAAWGGAGMVVFAGASIVVWRRSPAHRRALLPWLFLALFAVASGALTGLGRVGLGVAQAISGRYVAYSSLFWVSLAVVVTLACAERWPARGARRVLANVAVGLVLAGAAVGYGWSWEYGRAQSHERQRALLRGGACLRDWAHAPDQCLKQLFVSADWVRSGAAGLERNGLGPFAEARAGHR